MASKSDTGLTPYFNSALSNTVVAVKTTGGRIYGYHIINTNIDAVYIQFFNLATGDVTIGTTTPDISFQVPAGGVLDAWTTVPLAMSIAISVAATTAATNATAPSTAIVTNIFYL